MCKTPQKEALLYLKKTLLLDSHPGPNYAFIIENSSQLFSDKMFLATGQQLIVVIKPPFDFICSDSMEQDRHSSDRQSGLSLVPAWEECCFKVDSHSSPLPWGVFMKLLGSITHPFHMHYQWSSTPEVMETVLWILVTFFANRLWLEAKSILITVIHLVLFFKRCPALIVFSFNIDFILSIFLLQAMFENDQIPLLHSSSY